MKVHFERGALLAALTPAASVVSKRNTIEILGYVQIDALMGECRFRATDLDMEASTTSGADVADMGVVCVDASRLRSAVQLCGSEITVEHGLDADPRLTVKSGKSRFRLPVLPSADFPEQVERDWLTVFDVPCIDVLEILETVAFAVSKDIQGQFYLTGIRLEVHGNDLVAVGTNKHRIAKALLALPKGAEAMPSVSVPIKMVQETIAMLGKLSGSCRVSVSKSAIRIQTPETVLTSKLIEADYLDFSRAIPVQVDQEVMADREALIATVKRASLAGDTGAEGQGVRLTFRADALSVLGKNPEADSSDEMEIDYDGPEVSVGVVARYVIEALSRFTDQAVMLGITKNVVRVTSQNDPSIVMAIGTRIVPL